jgi:hypothetical protein
LDKIAAVVSLEHCVRIVENIEGEDDDANPGQNISFLSFLAFLSQDIHDLEDDKADKAEEEGEAEPSEVIPEHGGEKPNQGHNEEDAADLVEDGGNVIVGEETKTEEEDAGEDGEEGEEKKPGDETEGCKDEKEGDDEKEEGINEEIGLEVGAKGVILAEEGEGKVEDDELKEEGGIDLGEEGSFLCEKMGIHI